MNLRERLRRLTPACTALVLCGSLFVAAQQAVAVGGAAQAAAPFRFVQMPIAMPPGYNNQHMNTIRTVNPAFQQIDAWISSVGASIAINDVTGHGRADGMCIVDTRTNDVVVTYTPTASAADRFTPFVLDPSPLPYDGNTMAPTGCTPGDFTGDGRIGFLVTYWGRTPILFLPRSTAETPAANAYVARELVSNYSPNGSYNGPQWNTDAVYVGDLDGSGHPSIIVGNYFPDSAVLDAAGPDNVTMLNSLSSAKNGGGDLVYQWYGATSGADPTVEYTPVEKAIPYGDDTGWTLAISGADLTGDGRPDVYIANDFGHGTLLYNRSTPGHISFTATMGVRTPTTPKSFVLGNSSFKDMGVDFADLDGTGRFDILVSNITVPDGLEESNFVFVNKTSSDSEMASDLARGLAPFDQEAQQYGLAWNGWGWDVKSGDFLNDGQQEVIQANGFVKGDTDRWNWLQETAMANDDLLSNPAMWPYFTPGTDLAGHESLGFFARNAQGTYVNVNAQLGLDVETPTRGIATADTTGTGRLDFAVARQWGAPAFYANEAPAVGNYLELELYRPSAGTDTAAASGLDGPGSPAYGTTVTISTPSGRQISQLDGGGGHGGFRSFDVHFGLGSYSGEVTAHLSWRDSEGRAHEQSLSLEPGRHDLMLTDSAAEIPNS
ncbi:CRTAC1 family protein [Actinospica robiniae]|uniref:CRTAC1 family protein n=1 Tax=Actinospica robiniae TaxID=304901 RepID=UPI00040E8F2B|nr:CRTAC1 family protein [Actinospica robiniae]